jgi:hypothetical protein
MVKKSRVVLFGPLSDPETKKSAAKIFKAGRKVSIQASSSHPDGTGPCGKICSCKEYCVSAFEGDQGAMMGTSY